MKIKHSWGQSTGKTGIFSKGFFHEVTMRCSLDETENAVLEKYETTNTILYSNYEAHERAVRTTAISNWTLRACEGWFDEALANKLIITMHDLMVGITVKDDNPYFIEHVFSCTSENAKNLLTRLIVIDKVYDNEEIITEYDTSSL